MKRWLILLTSVAAVLAVAAPGLIGRRLDADLDAADRASGATLDVHTIAVESGWFTSTARHRVTLLDDDLAALARLLQPALPAYTPPVLIVAARIAHGPLPLAALNEPGGTAWPAFAAAAVSLGIPVRGAAPRPLPGVLTVRLGLFGSLSLRYRIPARVPALSSSGLAWQAADLALVSTADSGELEVAAALDGLRWQAVSVAALQAKLTSVRHGERTDVGLSAKLGSVQAGGEILDVRVHLTLAAVDTAAAVQLAALLRQPDDDASVQAFDIKRDRALRRLLAAGGTLDVHEGLLTTVYGDIDVTARVALGAVDEGSAWRELAGAANGSVRLSLPAALVASGSPYRDPLLPLVAGGYLAADGDRYRLRADIVRGALTVNGAPLAYAFD